MPNLKPTIYLFVLSIILLFSCKKDEDSINTTPTISLTSPINNHSLEPGNTEQLLSWKAKDKDNDELTFDLYYGETLPESPNQQNLKQSSFLVPVLPLGKTIKWKVVAKDQESTTSSEIWDFSTIASELTELTVNLNTPVQNSTLAIGTNKILLNWTSTTNSKTPITYDLYIGESIPDEPTINNLTENSYEYTTLEGGKNYQWKIVAKDQKNTISSEIWDFNTTATELTVNLNTPEQNAILAAGTDKIQLNWTGTTNSSTPITYDLYIGENIPTEPTATNLTQNSYEYTLLENGKTYQWKVVSKTNSTEVPSEVRTFSIQAGVITGSIAWTTIERANTYEVQIGDTPTLATVNTGLTTLKTPMYGLVNGTTYTYRIYGYEGATKLNDFHEGTFTYTDAYNLSIHHGNLELNNQQEINDFQTNAYTHINEGYLIIDGPAINNIDGLTSLRKVEGGFALRKTTANFDTSIGFANLKEVVGDFALRDNKGLLKITFSTLTSTNHFYLYNNDILTTLEMPVLRRTNRFWIGSWYDHFVETSGLSLNYDAIYHNKENKALETIVMNELTDVVSIGIGNNEKLTNIDFLRNITNVPDGIKIQHNSSLINLNGLSNLVTVSSGFEILNNINLIDISLPKFKELKRRGFTKIGRGELLIGYNTKLTIVNLPVLIKVETHLGFFYNPELESISSIRSKIRIASSLIFANNVKFKDYCNLKGIRPGGYSIKYNLYNPDLLSLNDENCSL